MKKEYLMKLEKIEDLGWVELNNERGFAIYGKTNWRLIYFHSDDSIIRIYKDSGFGGYAHYIKHYFNKKFNNLLHVS